MKYNQRAKDLVQSEANHDNNSSHPTYCSLNITEKVPVSMSPVKSYSQEQTTSRSVENVMLDTSSGLTQQISELTINDDISRFLIPVGTILFYPDRKDNLYKVFILEHDLVRSQVRCLHWGPNYDEWVCSKSIWAYSQFTQLLSTVKKIPKLPSFVAPAFCSATLTALNKKKTGIRPIALCEVIRRLVAKCIATEAAIEAVELFGSKQLGVAVKFVAENIVHATKIAFEIMKSVKSGGMLQIDFRNAFNSVKRSHLLGSTKVLMPSIISFASFCYSKHSDLFFNRSIVDSQTGVH